MLIPDKYTFIFVAINLVVLYLFMKRFLFKPITTLMENRKNSIEKSLREAEDAKLEVTVANKNYEEKINNIKKDSDKLLNEARTRAGREYDEIVATAKKDALAIIERGRVEVEHERAEMLQQVRQQITVLALSMATKVVQANMDTDANKILVDKFIDEVGAA